MEVEKNKKRIVNYYIIKIRMLYCVKKYYMRENEYASKEE